MRQDCARMLSARDAARRGLMVLAVQPMRPVAQLPFLGVLRRLAGASASSRPPGTGALAWAGGRSPGPGDAGWCSCPVPGGATARRAREVRPASASGPPCRAPCVPLRAPPRSAVCRPAAPGGEGSRPQSAGGLCQAEVTSYNFCQSGGGTRGPSPGAASGVRRMPLGRSRRTP